MYIYKLHVTHFRRFFNHSCWPFFFLHFVSRFFRALPVSIHLPNSAVDGGIAPLESFRIPFIDSMNQEFMLSFAFVFKA